MYTSTVRSSTLAWSTHTCFTSCVREWTRSGRARRKRRSANSVGPNGTALPSDVTRRVTAYASTAYAYRGLQQLIEETAPVLKRLNANIPQSLHDTFKVTCAQRRVPMGDALIDMIREWCQPPLSVVEDPDGILSRCSVELSAAESQRLIDAGRHADDLGDTVRDWSRQDLLEFARHDAQHATFRALVEGFMIDQQTGDGLDFALSGPAKSALYAHAYAVCAPAVLERLADLLDAD